MTHSDIITINTQGFSDIIDITGEVQNILKQSSINEGIVNVFVIGSTASVSTIEYEPALVKDFQEFLQRLLPSTMESRHSRTWGDDNGFSHIRATLMGPSFAAPFQKGRLILGTWQQIVVIDHDNRPRERKIHIQIVGD